MARNLAFTRAEFINEIGRLDIGQLNKLSSGRLPGQKMLIETRMRPTSTQRPLRTLLLFGARLAA
jgi:hypothetical protein